MAEELLRLEQAHATLDEPGREGVPEGVTGGSTVTFDLGGVAVTPGAVDRVAYRLSASASRRLLALIRNGERVSQTGERERALGPLVKRGAPRVAVKSQLTGSCADRRPG
jgi:hypothetical protein